MRCDEVAVFWYIGRRKGVESQRFRGTGWHGSVVCCETICYET